jgi:hypothetical protein
MSYIGRNIDSINNISTLDNLSFNGSDATFNLTQNSVAFVPVSADALQIQIDGVIQSGNYTVSGSTVTFDFVPSGSSVCNGIKHFGVGLLSQPSDGSVNMAQLGASGTKDATTFLRGDNTFATVSGTTINNNADNRVITGSGTANTLEGEANLTFDGNTLTANKVILTNSSGLTGGASSDGFITNADDTDTGIVFPDSDRIQFWTADVERFRIDANGTSDYNIAHSTFTKDYWVLKLRQNTDDSATNYMIAFTNRSNTTLGSITTNGSSSTSFNTSSDYRLKENVVDMTDATTRLKQLQPKRFNFKTNADTTVDGFIAHEVSSIVPEAITGEKDAMAVETRYTADDVETQGDNPSKKVGDAKTYSTTEIDAQGIDQSKLVPLLTSALQEAITKIETLEARVQALENA